ncbi:MAG: ATP-binding cassette domain-containing protein [Caldilineaceae bacterium]
MGDLLDLGNTYQETKSALFRLDDLLDTDTDPGLPGPGDVAAGAGAVDAAPTQRHVGTAQRDLRLQSARTAAHSRLQLDAASGKPRRLVGATGSGKSTIANLVVGLYEPWSGDILFDNRPFPNVDRRVVTNSLSKVDQEIFLFDGTVMQNLTLWDTTIPSDQVIAAATDACIHDAIAAGPTPTTAMWRRAAPTSAAARRSVWRLPAPWSWSRRCSSWTKRPARSTRPPKPRSTKICAGVAAPV